MKTEERRIEVRMRMTPDESLFHSPEYEVYGDYRLSFFRVRDLTFKGIKLGYKITRYDREPPKPERLIGYSLREGDAAKKAHKKALGFASELSRETHLPVADLSMKDTLELIATIEEIHRNGTNPDVDPNREAEDIHGNPLRPKFGLQRRGER